MVPLQRYPAYKDSGVEWIGDIPEGWEVTRLGTRFQERKSKVSDKDYAPLSVTKNGVLSQLMSAAKTNDGDNRKLVKQGDFVINSRSDRKGSSGISFHDGSVSLINIVIEPKAIHPIYCDYLLKGHAFIEEFYRIGHGIVADLWTTRYDEMKNIKIFVPSLPEQTAIANFLDEKCSKIDRAVGQKEKLVELLKERKQIVIQNAVTKGLNPNAKMKDSGVEWIGNIPDHWEVRRSKYIFAQRKELARKNDVQLSATQAYGVIPQKDYEKKIGRRVVKIQFHLDKRKHVEMDDFVISMRSFQGGLERAWSTGCIRSSYIILCPLKKISTDYYSYLFKSSRYIAALQTTANFIRDGQDLNFGNFTMVDLPIVALEEQREIAGYINSQSSKIETAITLQQKQIEKLKEYKATLINSAVTGKIKVVQ